MQQWKNKYNVAMDPGIKINTWNKSKVKNPANYLAKSIFRHNPKYIFFVASREEKINLIPHIVFKFYKFKTSDNLVGWDPMPDNASPK